MKQKIGILSVTLAALFALSLVGFANTQSRITYDFGAAAVRAESIVNDNPDTYEANTATPLQDPSCPGFEFMGWYREPDYQTLLTQIPADTSGDITVYAKWYEMTYTVTYILTTDGIALDAGDVFNPNASTRAAGEALYLSAPECPTNVYVFDGWYLDSEYTQKVTVIDAYTCENITLYAHWRSAQFSIQYDIGDVSSSVYTVENPNPAFYEFGTALPLSDASTPDPSYTFAGWYTDEFFTEPITEISAGTQGNLILFAKWEKTVYTISYVLADGSGIREQGIQNSNPDTRTAEAAVVLNSPVSEEKSFRFAGWFTSPDFDENTRILVIETTCSENLTLYAKWETAVYTIQYDYGMVNLLMRPIENPNPTQYEYGDEILLTAVEADGFLFNGWCTDSDRRNPITEFPADSYGDITLYADFIEKTYTVQYVTENNGITSSQVVNSNPSVRTATQGILLEDAQTINPEYEFGGWYADAALTIPIREIRSYTTQTVTVYAKWIRIVSYLPVWGDVSLSNQLEASDARLVLRNAVSLESFSELQSRLADIDNDSRVTAADARLILRLASGLESEEAIIEKYALPTIALVDGEVVFLEA